MEPSASRELRPRGRIGDLVTRVRAIDPRAVDGLVALGLTVAALGMLAGRIGEESQFREVDLLALALVLLQTLPLAVRRVAPLGVLVLINAAVVIYAALGYEVVEAGVFSSLVSVYGAASLTDGPRSLLAGAITLLVLALYFATTRDPSGAGDVAVTSGTWVLGWLAGTYVRVRGEQAEAAGERAEMLERDQEVRAREAVADERARMARELHDIIGHTLNLIVIQAGGAQRVFESRPEVARDSLAAIETAGRAALSDMERMLGVLRTAEAADGSLGPQPGLAQLDDLAAHVSEAGVPVEVVVEGSRPEVPASVELSAYRIVQESLTNCLKHSGASHATVTVRYRPDEVEVEVADNGPGSPEHTENVNKGGRGHLGMRERVALFGGEISFGPMSSAGGYRVRARLPFRSTPG